MNIEKAKALMEFVKNLEKDPAFLLVFGEDLGYQLGGERGYWFTNEFMKMTPFKKGIEIGWVLGHIAVEILLLFLPAEWIVGGARVAGLAIKETRLGKAMLRLLERMPGIKSIIEADRAFEASRAAAKSEQVIKEEKMIVEGSKTSPIVPEFLEAQQARAIDLPSVEPLNSELIMGNAVPGAEAATNVPTPSIPELEPTCFPPLGKVKARKPTGFGKTPEGKLERATPSKSFKHGTMPKLETTAYEPTKRPPKNFLTTYLQRHGLTFGEEGRAARAAFEDARPEIAKALGVQPGEHVHHAIELQNLDYYPEVFTPEELNSLNNMRGIPEKSLVPGGPTGDKLHNSLIRKILDQRYEALDKAIEEGGYLPGYPDFNALVRQHLEMARKDVDELYRSLFRWPKPKQAGAHVPLLVPALGKLGMATEDEN